MNSNNVRDFKIDLVIEDHEKSKEQLIAELAELRNEILALEQKSLLSETVQERSRPLINFSEEEGICTILMVEDSEIDRTCYRLFLTRNSPKNYQIVEFSNAEDALIWCIDHVADIMLIDYVLPGMNGLDFLSELQQQVRHERTPCIIMTNQAEQELAIQSLKSGAKDFLNKGKMTPEGLNRAVTNVLQQSYWIEEQELQRERQNLVNMIAYSIRQSFELDGIFEFTLNELRRLLQCDRVLIYQFQSINGDGKIINESVVDPALSLLGQEITDICFEKSTEWVELYRQGRICSIENIEADSSLSACYQQFLKNIHVQAKLVVPIVQEKHLWGLLIAHQCTATRHWTVPEIELLNLLSMQIEIAIQKVGLQQQAQKERQENREIEKTINYIASGLVAKIGEDFFQLLICYLSQILEVDYVCIAELTNAQTAETLAVCHHQQIIDNFEINLKNQPYSKILGSKNNTVQIYQNNLQDLFFEHKIIQSSNIHTFLGICLVDSSQKAIGFLTILHSSSLENIALAEKFLKVFGSRAGAELERQQIEAKLRKSEADLLEAQRIAHVGHWKWNKNINELWWSEEVYHIFGVALKQKITFDFFIQQIHPLDRDRVLQETEAALRGHTFRTVYRLQWPNNETRFIKILGKVIFDKQGNAVAMRGVVLDITELKKAELELQRVNLGLEEEVKARMNELTTVHQKLQNELCERKQIEAEKEESEIFYSNHLEKELNEKQQIAEKLKESEIRYRRIVETSSEGIWQLDKNKKTVFVNPRMAEMLGYSVEEITKLSLLDLIDETDKEPVKYLIEQRENNLISQYDLQFRRKNGTIMWTMVSARSVVDEEGKYLGRLKMITDISDRKRAEAALQEFNRRWRSVLDTIQMIVVELDKYGNVEYVNPFFEKVFQFSSEEVLGKNWLTTFVPAHSSEEIEIVFEEILKNEAHSHYENPILIKSGEERLITWRNSVLKDNSGQPTGLVAIGEDITERNHLEQMKSEFVSIVSHELKTPLTAIQASLSLLHEKIVDPNSEEGEESISIAVDGVDRLVRLVNDILDIERLRSGKINLKKIYCDTQEIIKKAIAEIRQLAERSNVTINLPSCSLQMYADCDRIVQVLINLISNAIKFSPMHSTIDLLVESRMPESTDKFNTSSSLLFKVCDQGRGIAAQHLETVFERFKQIDASDSRDKEGTGLGLAICRDIVEQHGGKIWVESVLTQGSTFCFSIPTEPLEDLIHDQ